MLHFHPLRVADVRQETDDTVSIAFDIPAEQRELFAYQSGQYLTVRAQLNGEDVRRSYSLCSAPYEGTWRVAVKQVENGRFSTYANTSLKAGDTLEVMPPQGRFVVHPERKSADRFVFFAAGSGITPVLSLVKQILHDHPQSEVTLFYANRKKTDVIFLEELEDLKNRNMQRLSLHYIFSQESQSSPLFEGRIDGSRCQSLLDRFVPDPTQPQYFICGPEEMIHAVKDTLITSGVPADQVHFELFTTPVGDMNPMTTTRVTAKPARTDAVAKVQVQLDGRVFSFDLPYNGKAILDASMQTGADLPFSCKGGVCCTCRAKLVKGEVDMDVNYALEPWEVEQGFILTCQSHPKSEEIFVDFDQQ
ncbi:MAG: phenylacetate-CoA oxygenase/reductase subunit PaaK [Saprospiraceae bacterium]|nr:phenylacetate-CoA oxygenase/reductase subunit PaaK [Saprospiraceae bacterium]